MKTLNRIFLGTSLIYMIIFLLLIHNWCGMTSSISRSVKYLTPEGKDIYFFFFIVLSCISFMWVARSWLMTISAMLLIGIGIITGYNQELNIGDFQHLIHTILTTAAIWIGMAEIVRRNELIGHILVSAFALFTLISFVSKYPNHTYWIEVSGFAVAYMFYFAYPLNKKK